MTKWNEVNKLFIIWPFFAQFWPVLGPLENNTLAVALFVAYTKEVSVC